MHACVFTVFTLFAHVAVSFSCRNPLNDETRVVLYLRTGPPVAAAAGALAHPPGLLQFQAVQVLDIGASWVAAATAAGATPMPLRGAAAAAAAAAPALQRILQIP